MPDPVLAAACGVGAFVLARRLCGDPLAAAVAAAAYALAPGRGAFAGPAALWPAALPPFLWLFYRTSESEESPWRAAWPCALALAVGAAVAPAFSICAGAFVWLLILGGFAADRRRSWAVWSPAFGRWGAACLEGALLYFPLWLLRAWHPRVPFPPSAFGGVDAAALLTPGAAYLGLATLALAACGAALSRSYRSQARLWLAEAGLLVWLSCGADFLIRGRPLWWIPCLYLAFAKLPWLRDVPPILYVEPARLALALTAAFGVSALLARLPAWKLTWTRAAAAAVLGAAVAADFLRR